MYTDLALLLTVANVATVSCFPLTRKYSKTLEVFKSKIRTREQFKEKRKKKKKLNRTATHIFPILCRSKQLNSDFGFVVKRQLLCNFLSGSWLFMFYLYNWNNIAHFSQSHNFKGGVSNLRYSLAPTVLHCYDNDQGHRTDGQPKGCRIGVLLMRPSRTREKKKLQGWL